jgi:hypothetical protein
MAIRSSTKKIKLGKIGKARSAPRWADMRKWGNKRAGTRRVNVDKIKRWKRSRIKV